MKMKLLLTLAFLIITAPGVFAQAAGGGATKTKVAIVAKMRYSGLTSDDLLSP